MRVAVTGSSGLVGTELAALLHDDGAETFALVRRAPRNQSEVAWDPARAELDEKALGKLDAVVHLAGENIGNGRWTKSRKHAIRDSRVVGTRTLAEALSRMSKPPGALVCASAVGYYGDRGPEKLTENSAAGRGFLADVVREWEEAAGPASRAGIRVVHLRLGVVLSSKGGALARMLTPFRFGLGGVLGPGTQYVSWIALADAARAFRHALVTAEISGPINAVAPEPVTNRELTETLGRVLHRPTFIPAPRPLLELALGQMAEELLLASTRVEPVRLPASGFTYLYPRLEAAIRAALESHA